MSLMADGSSDKAIAASLGISVRTVRFHVAAARIRLGAAGRSNAVSLALSTGQLDRPDGIRRTKASRRRPRRIDRPDPS